MYTQISNFFNYLSSQAKRRTSTFTGMVIGWSIGDCIARFFGWELVPQFAGSLIIGLAVGVFLLGPIIEYCWQEDETQESLS